MTYRVDIADAAQHLITLIQAAAQGEEVIITKNQRPLVQLVPVTAEHMQPRFGSARGQVFISDDFDAPLDDFREYLP